MKSISIAEYKTKLAEDKPRKYRNKPLVVDGERFDSRKEYRRYKELVMWQSAGEVKNLRRQVTFALNVNGIHIADYVADHVFSLKDKNGFFTKIVEDVKSKATKTRAYEIKKKLVRALYGVDIQEV